MGALCALTLGTAGTFAACKKNPVDAGLEYLLDNAFVGFYEASDGTQIELVPVTGGWDGFIRKVGTALTSIGARTGDRYFVGMTPTGKYSEYRGYIETKSGRQALGTVTLWGGGMIEVKWDTSDDMILQHLLFNKIATPSTPGTPNPGNPGTPSGDIELLYLKNLEGADLSSKVYKVTVPSGAKKLVVKTFEEDINGHNLGDLFVKRGSQPSVSRTPSYSWTADCASVNPNREDDICSFTNPAAGDWYIMLYGYHAYYATSLRVTYSK